MNDIFVSLIASLISAGITEARQKLDPGIDVDCYIV